MVFVLPLAFLVVILPYFKYRLTCFCRFVSLLSRFAFFSPFLFYSVFKVHLVGSSGLEPPTSRLSGACSSLLSYEPVFIGVSCLWMPVLLHSLHCVGGDEEIRTLDPLLAGQVLSQLSYTPVSDHTSWVFISTFQGSHEPSKLNND